MSVAAFKIVVTNLPWIIQIILVYSGTASKIIWSLIDNKTTFCVNFTELETRKEENREYCVNLFGPWSSFTTISVITWCSIATSMLISKNDWVLLIGVLAMAVLVIHYLIKLYDGTVLNLDVVLGYSLLAAALSFIFNIIAINAPP